MGKCASVGADIICDGDTYEHVVTNRDGAATIQFTSRGVVSVKGRTTAVAVYTPAFNDAQQTIAKSTHTMFGRQQQMDILTSAIDSLVSSGSSSVLLVEGEAGGGKSRLIQETLSVTTRRVSVLYGSGHGMTSKVPFSCWRNIVPLLTAKSTSDAALADETVTDDTYDADDAAEAVRISALLKRCGMSDDEMCLMNEFVGVNFAETELVSAMSSDMQTRRIAQVMTRLINIFYESNGAALCVIENVQWIDPQSWAVIEQLSAGVRGLILILTARPSHSLQLKRLRTRPLVQIISLPPLSRSDIEQLCADRLKTENVPSQFTDTIKRVTQGNPLFIHEMIDSMPNAQSTLLSATTTMSQIMTSRIDKLQPFQQDMLKAAAVIGLEFDLRLLSLVMVSRASDSHVTSNESLIFEYSRLATAGFCRSHRNGPRGRAVDDDGPFQTRADERSHVRASQ